MDENVGKFCFSTFSRTQELIEINFMSLRHVIECAGSDFLCGIPWGNFIYSKRILFLLFTFICVDLFGEKYFNLL